MLPNPATYGLATDTEHVFANSSADMAVGCCRLYRADNKVLLYSGIAQALLTAWALLLSVTAGTQPVIACKSYSLHAHNTVSREAANETSQTHEGSCMLNQEWTITHGHAHQG